MTFLIATKNKNKLKEFARILEPLDVKIINENELNHPLPDVEETGSTFEDNAIIKASSAVNATGMAVIADDSGLCVDALNGNPGIFSARFAGQPCNDGANNNKLLDLLLNTPENKRTARFVCVVACVFPDGKSFTVSGECEGRIGFEPKGNNGFGYDPLFLTGKGSFAELTAEEKDKISHRSLALAKFSKKIKEYL